MRIEVWIEGWEQGCCGTLFRIGDAISWDIHAAEPGVAGERGLAVYREEHHGQTPDAVPHRYVRGVVRGIRAVSYPSVWDSANGARTADTSRPSSREIDVVDSATSGAEFRVEFEVDDAEALPAYAPDPAEAGRERRWEEARRLREEEDDDATGIALSELADRLQTLYRGVVRVSRLAGARRVTFRPRVSEAAPIQWVRDGDAIRVFVGGGRLDIPLDSVGKIERIVNAVAEGRVTQTVEAHEDGMVLAAELDLKDGDRCVARSPFLSIAPTEGADGSIVSFGSVRPPISGRRYAPWR